MTQKEALEILKMGHSVFLTGAAGTGKTFVLNQYINYLKSHNINPSITASTGIAATHIGGQTIHSFSGIGIMDKLDSYTLDKLDQNEKLYKRYQNVKVLIIDEISMLHASRLDMVNTLFKRFRHSNLPFAGIQVIFCGDFFQLPPVVKNQNESEEKHFAYNSKAWQELNPVICYLDKNYRQKEDELTSILNNIRYNKDMELVLEKLKQKVTDKENIKDDLNTLKLHTHNIDVDSINEERYTQIDQEEKVYTMTESGKEHLIQNLKNNCLAQQELKLKKGTKVVFIKNDQFSKYQNGTLGEVIDFDISNSPIIKTLNGQEIIVNQDTWEYLNDEGTKSLASISQLPIRYAWAITIHKSQGMTLDKAEIDLSKAFGSGMGYVALSRVKEIDNIKLIGIDDEALKINKNVLEKDIELKERSKRAREALEKYFDNKENPTRELIKKQEEFILKNDGSLLAIDQKEIEKIEKKEKIKTHIETYNLIKERIPLAEIASKRDLKISTISTHIEKLIQENILDLQDINFLKKEIEDYLISKKSKDDLSIILKELEKVDFKITKEWKEKMESKLKSDIDYDVLNLLKINFD